MAGSLNSGRRPKPTALHKMHGTRAQARAIKAKAGHEPQPAGDLREPPETLTPGEREEWDYAIQNSPRGLLKRIDRNLLVRWVKVCDRLRIAEEHQRELDRRSAGLPFLVRGPAGLQISPYLSVIDRCTQQMMQLSDRLGFSPVARPRIHIEPTAPQADDNLTDTWGVLKRFPVIDGGKA